MCTLIFLYKYKKIHTDVHTPTCRSCIDRYLYCIWTLSPSARLLLFSCVNLGRLRLSAVPVPND